MAVGTSNSTEADAKMIVLISKFDSHVYIVMKLHVNISLMRF